MGVIVAFVRGAALAVVAVTGVAGAGVAPVAAAATAVPAGTQPAPAAAIRPGFLEAVSCPGATTCTAVGEHPQETSLAERWGGTKWALQRTPSGGPLNAVSCPSATACTALGGSPEALAWNGTTWASQRVPIPTANGSGLTGVSCTSPTACTAVGYYYTANEMEQLLWVGRWNGTKWTSQAAPSPPTSAEFRQERFQAVSCTSLTACVAVGFYTNAPNSNVPLVEAWNGTTWAIQPADMSFSAPFNALYGVSCRSATACIAVGTSYDAGAYEPLAERWNGTSWTIQPTPSPDGGDLVQVSCTSARACTAVGFSVSSDGTQLALADRWDGTAWALQHVANPSDGSTPVLTGVSCRAATACTAVGVRNGPPGSQRLTLAERWNGTSWTIQPT